MAETGKLRVGVEAYGVERTSGNGRFVLSERLICKFLIVAYDAELSLLFGPVKTFTYHAMLLDKYCTENIIAAAWLKPRELLEVLDRRLQTKGGGWMEFLPGDRSLRIFGASTAYGRYHRPSLDRILSADSAFSPFTVRIDPA
jgi:hypothetical protein